MQYQEVRCLELSFSHQTIYSTLPTEPDVLRLSEL